LEHIETQQDPTCMVICIRHSLGKNGNEWET
jgi:hypothetical protein